MAQQNTTILTFQDKHPDIADSVFLATGSIVIGDVTIGDQSSVWFHTVIRGDVESIRIGARTNVQDHSMLHVTTNTWPLLIGDDVTVGHRVILHGCTIGNRVLIGMGAIVMDGAVIHDDVIIGAGALVTPGTDIPSGSLVVGSPARVKRTLSEDEKKSLLDSATHYAELARVYRTS